MPSCTPSAPGGISKTRMKRVQSVSGVYIDWGTVAHPRELPTHSKPRAQREEHGIVQIEVGVEVEAEAHLCADRHGIAIDVVCQVDQR